MKDASHRHFIRFLAGERSPLTPSLSVTLPKKEEKTDVKGFFFPLCQKEEMCLEEKPLPNHLESFKEFLQKLPSSASFFIDVLLHGPIEDNELSFLKEMKKAHLRLVLNGKSLFKKNSKTLSPENIEEDLLFLKDTLGESLSLRLFLRDTFPMRALLPWAVKLSIKIGSSGFLFLDKDPSSQSLSLMSSFVRKVQDSLENHPLSQGAAPLVPILRPFQVPLKEKTIDLIDFISLDALLIESNRPFFGGLATHDFSLSSPYPSEGCLLIHMIEKMRASSSIVEEIKALGPFPEKYRASFLRSFHTLALSLQALKEGKTTCHLQEARNELKSIWDESQNDISCQKEAISSWALSVETLLEQVEASGGLTKKFLQRY
jgi:hypothetical protein